MSYILDRLKNPNFIILLLSDMFLIVLGLFFSVLLRYDFSFPPGVLNFIISYHIIIIFVFIKLLSFKIFGLYRGMWRYTSIWDMINLFKANLLASILIICLIYVLVGFSYMSRAIFVLDFCICYFLISSSRIGIRLFFLLLHLIIK